MAEGFLSRWSRRKLVQQDEPTKQDERLNKPPEEIAPAEENVIPPASLADVEKIDPLDPDFSAFMKPDVDPHVQQAALKKMFTDPHFNVMDRLDIYIDDYSHPEHNALLNGLNVEFDQRGNVKTDENYMTSRKGVFSAGDMRRGQSLIVWAISEGRRAAHYIDKYLMGYTSLPII